MENSKNARLDTLTAVVCGLLPEEVLQHRPADVIATRVWQIIQANPSGTLRADFERMVSLLGTGIGGLILAGKWKPFTPHAASQAEPVLLKMANSRNVLRRRAFQALKRIIMLVAYGDTVDGKPNPLWKEIGYPGAPDPTPVHETRVWQPLACTGDQNLRADYIIIGSGAGGSVVAAALAKRGFEVLVLEKGYDCPAGESGLGELDGMQRYFLNQGVLATKDLGITLLAGSAVGGGTTVNWTTCMRPPAHVFEEWQSQHQLHDWSCSLFEQLYSEVEQEMGITNDTDPPNRPNELLEVGCASIGMKPGRTLRNVAGCKKRCGHCTFGCPYGAKRSTPHTYLAHASQHGMRLLPRANVRKIISVDQVEGYYTGVDGQAYSLTAQAGRAIVLAAGALETPALLMRSFHLPQAGRNLCLHPTAVVFGHYKESVNPWQGAPQSVFCDELLNLDGQGYGVLLETPALYPGLGASALPWEGQYEHWELMKRLRSAAAFLAIARDCRAGWIRLGSDGEPIYHYHLDRKTGEHLLEGMRTLLTTHFEAGAVEAWTLHQPPLSFTCEMFAGRRGETIDWPPQLFDYEVNRLPLYSAHQMGTCRASGSRARSVTDPTGKVWGKSNLYVADAGLLPTALGVNPMLTIMAAAKWVASHIP